MYNNTEVVLVSLSLSLSLSPPPLPSVTASVTVPSGSVEASISAGSMFEEQLDGCSAFIMSSTVFLRLIQSEARLMAQIVPQPFHSHVLDHLTKQPIDFFMRDGEVSL